MFTQRQTILNKALRTAGMVLLLLTTAAQSDSSLPGNNTQTTEVPLVSNSSLTTHIVKSSTEESNVVHSFMKPCGDDFPSFCFHGGECMFPQDTKKPSCICKPLYHGPRCETFINAAHAEQDLDKVIGITIGAFMVMILVILIIICCAKRRCVKSPSLIKSEPSETSV